MIIGDRLGCRSANSTASLVWICLLGMDEVPKLPDVAKRGGFRSRAASVPLGADPNFRAATKAHPALLSEEYEALLDRLRQHDVAIVSDQLRIDGQAHCYISDPFGNRIEIIQGD